jgi:magnesium and cobalt exporter, CNNM family
MIFGLDLSIGILCAALSTFFGAALAGLAALGRAAKEGESRGEPPALTAFILRDTTGAMATWMITSWVAGLGAVVAFEPAAAAAVGGALELRARVGVVLATSLLLVLGLLLWKRLAESAARSYCVTAAALALPVYVLLYPLRRVLGGALSRLFPPAARAAGVLFAADVDDLAGNGDGTRLLDRDEREMIQRVFGLGETVVREIMVPRIDMVAIEESTPLAEVVELLKQKRHSRLPVYRNNVDNIVGFLHIKDVLANVDRLSELRLGDLLHPASFVPETKRIDELLSEMRLRRAHLAIVVDEYGGTAGLVTLEDVIEEVVGEIQDESERDQPLVTSMEDGSFRVDAKVDLDELNEKLHVSLPADEYDTLGGYLYSLAGKIPAAGDRFRDAGMEFVIGGVRGKRITQVIVRSVPPPAASETAPAGS